MNEVKLLPCPWDKVPHIVFELLKHKIMMYPEGFDIDIPIDMFRGFVAFLNNKGYYWCRITSFDYPTQCVAVYTSYDAMQRREADR
jgi:hypothetical protein